MSTLLTLLDRYSKVECLLFSFLVLEHVSSLSKWMDEILTNGIREIAYLQSYDYIDFLLPQFFKSSSKKLQCFIKTYGINKVLWNETRC